jgi:2-polyprenyl-3-methyl-5-hydroxy-6-metoxy-1,4-benzoquinol methylase
MSKNSDIISEATVQSEWNDCADVFDSWLKQGENWPSITRVVPYLLNQWGDMTDKTILDFGCGPGRFLPLLVETNASVYAYDFCLAQLRLAAKNNLGTKINFCSQINELKDSFFDYLLCSQVVICNPPHLARKLIVDICSKLLPGGEVAFLNTNVGNLLEDKGSYSSIMPLVQSFGAPYKTLIPAVGGNSVSVTDYFYTNEQISSMVEDAGLAIKSVFHPTPHLVCHIAMKRFSVDSTNDVVGSS